MVHIFAKYTRNPIESQFTLCIRGHHRTLANIITTPKRNTSAIIVFVMEIWFFELVGL
jgi:hypothetical protein